MARAKNSLNRESFNKMVISYEDLDVPGFTFIRSISYSKIVNSLQRIQILFSANRFLPSLTRQVFIYYCLNFFFTYSPHISSHILVQFNTPMPPKRNTRSTNTPKTKGKSRTYVKKVTQKKR